MSISHRTSRLKLLGAPAVEQLQNGRYQLTVNCTTMNSREDWYSANKARIFPDFGSLQSAQGSIDGLGPRQGEAYTDMRLVSAQSSTQQEQYIVTLVYATLGSSFVQVKDDTVSYTESGLRRVTRKSIAETGTDFQKTIGSESINSQIGSESAIECKLASYEIDDTDSYREVTEVYVQPGIISSIEDFEGSQQSFVQETFAQDADTPEGFSKAREEISNVDGIPTNRCTFLKNNVKLSESEDKVGSQLAIVQEWFKPEIEPSVANYIIANVEESNLGGFPTERYTFLKNNVTLSESEDEVGSQKAIVKEIFGNDITDPVLPDYEIASTETSAVDGIPTKRFTLLKTNIELSRSLDKVGSQEALVVEFFKRSSASDPTESDYQLAKSEKSNVGGFPTDRFTFLKPDVTLSTSQDKLGSLEIFIQEIFAPIADPSKPNFTEVKREESDVDGIKTQRVTFYKDDAIISRSTDKVGSQKSVVIEKFKSAPTAGEAAAFGDGASYEIARKEQEGKTNVEIYRYTFLEKNTELSRQTDKLGALETIITEVFNPTADKAVEAYTEVSREVSDFEGIKTERYTFYKNDAIISKSFDAIGAQKAVVIRKFKTEPTTAEAAAFGGDGAYRIAKKEQEGKAGAEIYNYTFLQKDVILSKSEDKLGALQTIVLEVFEAADSITESNFTEVSRETSNFEGVKTERVTFYKDDAIISESFDSIGSQKSVVIRKFKSEPTTAEAAEFGSGENYEIARKEQEGKTDVEIYNYTFLEADSVLSRSKDNVGSQRAIVTEIFKPSEDPAEEGYSIAKEEVSNVDGVPTKRFTLLMEGVELSRSEDNVGSQLAIITEVFKPEEDPQIEDYIIANVQKSDVGGFPTERYTFLKENVKLSESEDKVGSQLAIVQEWFALPEGEDPGLPSNEEGSEAYVIAKVEESDVGGIPTKRYTFLLSDLKLSEAEDNVGSQKAIIQEWFGIVEGEDVTIPDSTVPAEYIIAKKEKSNINGIPTERYTFLLSNVKLSESEDKVGSQLAKVEEWFGIPDDAEVELPTNDAGDESYVVANVQKSDIGGIPTERYTFLLSNLKLSETEDKVGSQLAIVQEWFGIPDGTDVTIPEGDPSGTYIIANVAKSDVGGIPTEKYTFLLENIKLSETTDKVGSQLSIIQEWFALPEGEEPELPDSDSSSPYVVANVQKSDVSGIPTERYTYLLSNLKLSETSDKVGSQLAIVQEWFALINDEDPTAPESPAGVESEYTIAKVEASNVGGIPTKRYTFLLSDLKLSETEDKVGSQLAIVQEWFGLTEDVELPESTGDSDYIVAKVEKSNVGGIRTDRYTFLLSGLKLSETEDNIGSQLAIVQDWFGIPAGEDVELPENTGASDYIVAKVEKSNIGGIPTERYTFLLSNIKLSETEDKIGSQSAIIQDWFGIPEGEDVTLPESTGASNYIIANVATSDVGGITTERYTFLLENIKLSETEDKVGSQLSIVQEWFALPEDVEPEPPTSSTAYNYVVANVQKSDVSGISTDRYTYLLNNLKLSETEDRVGSQLAKVQEWFGLTEGTEPEVPEASEGDYIIAKVDKSNIEGIPTERYTFLVKGIKLSETEDKVGAQLAIVQDWFGLDEDPDEPTADHVIANVERSDIGGIKTERYTFLKKNIKLSETEDKVGSQLTKVQEWFHPDEDPSIEEHEIANIQKSNMGGIPTEKYTFLKTDIKLSESEDRVGSQLAKIEEWFSPENEPQVEDYIIAKVEKSNAGGIPTEKYTFLKKNVQLSRSEDEVGSQKAIVTEVFKPDEDPTEGDHVIAKKETSNVVGIPTERFTFLKPDSILSTTLDNRKGSVEDEFNLSLEVIQVFNPEADPDPSNGGVLISKETKDEGGIPTKVFTFVHGEGEISNTESNSDPAFPSVVRERTIVHLGEPSSEPVGVVVSRKIEQQDGYEVHTIVSLEGEIEGITNEYEDYVEVEVPGEVELIEEQVSSGSVSGSIALVNVQPKRILKKLAKVKVEIIKGRGNIPDMADPAYDLGEISCSVTSTNLQLSIGPGSTVTIGAGTNNIMSDTGYVQDFKVQTSITNYPGHFLKDKDLAEGSIEYISSSQPKASGNSISRNEDTVTRETKLVGTGCNKTEKESSWKESGEISRRVRPILVDFDGNQYYEVRTVTIAQGV
tara:strand:+ start:4191 stop:10619 length:6429 start_codon:yes stop_codon:yes gene_type:complete